MADKKIFLYQLSQSLQLLAADYSVQVEVLPQYVDTPDEIALIFHDSYLLAGQIFDDGLITKEHLAHLENIEEKLSRMTKGSKFWSLDALKRNPEWNNIRELAKKLLASLGISQSRPDLYWITYTSNSDLLSKCE